MQQLLTFVIREKCGTTCRWQTTIMFQIPGATALKIPQCHFLGVQVIITVSA